MIGGTERIQRDGLGTTLDAGHLLGGAFSYYLLGKRGVLPM